MAERTPPIPSGLPIDAILGELLATLEVAASVVVHAPPGAGKSTIVPIALLEAGWLAGQRIIMLEPRRLAARAAAHRMAALLSETVGGRVGYRIRLETRVGPSTRIEVVTEGVLTRMLLQDPTLEDYGAVIFDEFHERSLFADTALALALHSRRLVRPDLRLLVMSATLDGIAIAEHLAHAPVLSCAGRQFPVDTWYAKTPHTGRVESIVAAAIRRALRETSGDVLVFLPGAPEIRRVMQLLAGEALPPRVYLAPLFGMLSAQAQDRAIAPAPHGMRKVVLSTSIAETSLTIEGVRTVVDSGLARVPRFSARTGLTRLHTVRASRAAVDQRRGRAGRVAPGVCIRLWSQDQDAQLLPFAPPEILDGDLVPLALDLAAAGIIDPLDLTWLDPPPRDSYVQATDILRQLAATDETGRITEHGRHMTAFGAHPRLAHMILRASAHRLGALACDLAALLNERDLLARDGQAPQSDIRLRLDLVRAAGRPHERARSGEDAVGRIRAQSAHWRALASAGPDEYDRDAAGRVLALAYPDRVAQRRRGAAARYVLRNGLGAVLPEGDTLFREEFLVIGESDGRRPEARVYVAAPLSLSDIEEDFSDQIGMEEIVEWNDEREVLDARRYRRLGAIVLAEDRMRHPDDTAVAAAIARAAERRGLALLPWSDEATRLRARLATLHAHDPSWPDVSDRALLGNLFERLSPQLGRVRAARDIRLIDVRDGLLGLLTWEQRAQLDRLAPTHYVAPTGSRIPIDYSDPLAPVVAIRLQELFGSAITPTVLNGRVSLTLHLLSPAGRPVQVTRDLARFWQTGYFDVRRELRGRYPKHHWPDDPLTAAPTSRAKRAR